MESLVSRFFRYCVSKPYFHQAMSEREMRILVMRTAVNFASPRELGDAYNVVDAVVSMLTKKGVVA